MLAVFRFREHNTANWT